MQQETAQELFNRHGHQFLLVPMGIIPSAEAQFASRKRNQSMARYRNAMRIACQVVQDMFRSAKGRFCIHDPWVSMQHPQKGTKRFLLRKVLQVPGGRHRLPPPCARLRPETNLPRNTLPSTPHGRKNRFLAPIQDLLPAVKPPAGTTQ